MSYLGNSGKLEMIKKVHFPFFAVNKMALKGGNNAVLAGHN